MRSRHPLALALAASLVMHGALTLAAVTWGDYVPVEPPRGTAVAAIFREPLLVPDPPESDPLGRRGGAGQAIADLDADDPLRSREKGQEQPELGQIGGGPLRSGAPSAMQMLAAVEREPSPLPPGVPVSQLVLALSPDSAEPVPPPPGALADAGEAPPARPSTAAPATTTPPQPAASDPGAADGREVSLFSQEAFADYRAGKAIARAGRDHKIRGMRAGLSAFVEAAYLPRPALARFMLRLGEDGQPIQVEVTRSSGSAALDEVLRKSLFQSWFDPDPSGRGEDLGKPFHFTIRIV